LTKGKNWPNHQDCQHKWTFPHTSPLFGILQR
jgi:hypothetical protein